MPEYITIRCYEELNYFLHYSKRKKAFCFPLTGKRTIKDIIESTGIPHTEVDLILANGQPVDFDYHPQDQDYISVYPVFESLDISKINMLRPKPLRKSKFIPDVHLGTLARYLRLTGFDTFYRNDLDDSEIIEIAASQQRIILTRDLQMLKNSQVTHGYYVRNTNPRRQLNEIINRFDLSGQLKPFTRCMACNGIIEPVNKEEIISQLLPNTIKAFNDFYRCNSCFKIYWKGSHFERMVDMVKSFSPSMNTFQ